MGSHTQLNESAVSVRPVRSAAQRRQFVRFPHRLYADDPNYRAPLDMMVREQMSAKSNPWFEHGEAEFFLAYRGEQVVGRISAQVDHLHLKKHADETGFFGFFEVKNDPQAAKALL